MTAVRWIEDNHYGPKLGFWSRANVGEVLPDPPSPLGWDLTFDAGGCVAGWRDCMTQRLGIGEDEVDETRPEVMGLFGGYGYLGISIMRIWAERTPGFTADALDAAYFAGHPGIPPYVAEPWHTNDATTEVMGAWLGWVMGDRDQSELEADRVAARAVRASRPDLPSLSDVELLNGALALKPVLRDMFNQHINQSGAASIGPGVLGAVCAAVGRPTDTMRLMGGVGDIDSAAPSSAMWAMSRTVKSSAALTAAFDLGTNGLTERLRSNSTSDSTANASASEIAAFVHSIDEFVAEFGSRGPNEWDLRSHTWETDPDIVLSAVDRMRFADDSAAPQRHQSEATADRLSLGAEISELLAGDPATQGQFNAALASASTFLAGRERSKTNIIRVLHEVRMSVWEIGRRAVDRGELDEARDVCLLFIDELEALAHGTLTDLRSTVEARRAHLDWLGSLEPPFIVTSTPPPNTEWPKRGANRAAVGAVGDVLTGLAGCPGVARGRARVVLDASDPGELEPGDILIAPMTDPAWTPLFVPAGGVVVNVGAPLSHAIIVSRELGIPCVVSVNGATERIPNGAIVEVDGNNGTVTIIELP